MSDNSSEDDLASSVYIAALYAGVGGALPTLCRLAPMGIEQSVEAILKLGHIVAIGIYAFIGFLVCLGLRERKYRQAFVLGIAAPGLITNILAGTGDRVSHDLSLLPEFSFFSVAHAEVSDDSKGSEQGFWVDLKRGLGFPVPIGRQDSPTVSELPNSQIDDVFSSLERDPNAFEIGDNFGGLPVDSGMGSLHPAFADLGTFLMADSLVNNSYSRFRYRFTGADETPMFSAGIVAPDILLRSTDREHACDVDGAIVYSSKVITAFTERPYYATESISFVLDAVAVAEESAFRARLARMYSAPKSAKTEMSGSCDRAEELYLDTAERLYHVSNNAVHSFR
ncbi:hypothetical protein [Marinobacter sp. F4218]|uniref:hypothetical protein n=1 Tax=Marinobacter sp. F4218 TaxID=2862868 RepID=UPI001C6366CF|nr:hypothetical protein [Marinobacter sp. F4218]MBW7472330.1 hypothetical protein [Marinobacter sp. F4218]